MQCIRVCIGLICNHEMIETKKGEKCKREEKNCNVVVLSKPQCLIKWFWLWLIRIIFFFIPCKKKLAFSASVRVSCYWRIDGVTCDQWKLLTSWFSVKIWKKISPGDNSETGVLEGVGLWPGGRKCEGDPLLEPPPNLKKSKFSNLNSK